MMRHKKTGYADLICEPFFARSFSRQRRLIFSPGVP
jgi:hypothetical protein